MHKCLEEIKRLKWGLDITHNERIELCEFIEEELKQAEENEKLLNVFKDALTIEHHEYPTIEHDDSEDAISCFVKELYTIRQNELDKDMRKALREWVLKNAFPKELKALDIIKKKMNEQNNSTLYFPAYVDLKGDFHLVFHKEEYELLREVLL